MKGFKDFVLNYMYFSREGKSLFIKVVNVKFRGCLCLLRNYIVMFLLFFQIGLGVKVVLLRNKMIKFIE